MVTIYQSWKFTASATPMSGAPSGAVAVDDDIEVVVRNSTVNATEINDATLGSMKDSLGNVYTLVDSANVSGNVWAYKYHSKVTVAGTPTIRLVSTGGGGFRGEGIVISGADHTAPLGQHNKNNGASTSGLSGNVTTTSPKGLLVGSYVTNTAVTTWSAGAGGYTLPTTIANADTEIQFESRNVSATGTYGAPISWTGGTIAYEGFISFYVDANQSGGVPLGFLEPDDAL